MAGTGIYYTVALEDGTGEFVSGLTLEAGDVKLTIMDANGTMGALANAVIVPVNEPAGSVIYKGEFDDTEIDAANVRNVPHIEVIFKDQDVTPEFRPLVYTYNGDLAALNRTLEIWQRLGLDPDNPLTTRENGEIVVGDMSLAAQTSGNTPHRTTIQTRS